MEHKVKKSINKDFLYLEAIPVYSMPKNNIAIAIQSVPIKYKASKNTAIAWFLEIKKSE